MGAENNMISCFRGKTDVEKDEGMKNLTRNGGILLEKLISFTNGRSQSIGRSFSLHDLEIATHNFDPDKVFMQEEFYDLYKGFLEDRAVIVRKYKWDRFLEECISDIVFSSQMKVHKNVLKLVGCCFESSIPILVFEYAENLSLESYIFNSGNRTDLRPLSWKNRLKIAVDVANVIAYLHTAFSRPVVHRGIEIEAILLDEHLEAKVSDFSLSISIPEGKTHQEVEDIGTLGYAAPEYYQMLSVNEKVDVYSFGVLLLVLLTRRYPDDCFSIDEHGYCGLVIGINKHIEKDRFEEIIDPTIVEEGPWSGKNQQLKAFTMLALRCTREDPEERPKITDVGKQLMEMYQSLVSTIVQHH